MGHLLGRLGRGVQAGALAAARAVGWAYHAIDPDVRSHIAQLPVVGASQLVRRPGAIGPLPDSGGRPVVFVHGLAGHPGNFVGLRAFFHAMGRTRTYLVDMRGTSDIDELAARVVGVVEEVAEVNGLAPDERIDVVAHSLGGLVARVALQDPACSARVRRLVTLGTPHGGTHTARFAATPLTLDLRPGSALLRRLESSAAADVERIVAFWSPADVFVLPAESAALPGARTIELPRTTHYGYLMRPRWWRAVLCETLDGVPSHASV